MSGTTHSDGQPLIEIRDGQRFRLEPERLRSPRTLTARERNDRNQLERYLGEKAQSRQTECWVYDCDRPPLVWVVEVSFDFKGDKAEPVVHSQISSADYPGPVPGFCWRHASAEWVNELARTVYFDRPEIRHGARPERWWVVFTDGSKAGGPCVQLLQ